MLATFVLIVSVVNRNMAYSIFAAWLVANWRLASISAGWDTVWLGFVIPSEWVHYGRQVAIAAYYVLTIALILALMEASIRRINASRIVRALQLSCLPMFAAALLLPYQSFLPVMWVLATCAIVGCVYIMGRVLWLTRSRVALWISLAMGVTLLSALYEIIAAAFGIKQFIGLANNLTGALASSLLAALAIAEHLRRAHADQARTYRVTPIGLATIGADGTVARMNDSFAQLAEIDPQDLPVRWQHHFPVKVLDEVRNELRGESGGSIDVIFALDRAEAGQRWYEVIAVQADDDMIEVSLQDITERKQAADQLEWLAKHDSLTSLLNRRGVEEALQSAYRSVSLGQSGSLAYLDLDRFKLANDLYGHTTGDKILQEVAARISACLNANETLGRVGGDEFVIVFVGVPLGRARAKCQQVVSAISNAPFEVAGHAVRIGVSVGLVELWHDVSMDEAMATADEACRAAKHNVTEHLVAYPHESAAFGERMRELQLIKRLDTPRLDSELLINMQPLLNLDDPFGTLNFEVLLRAVDRGGQPVATSTMIASAERMGMMQRIDLWVLERTLEFLEQHHEQLKSTRLACLNVSGASLNDERYVASAAAILRNFPRVARQICFEITETIALRDLSNTRMWIERQRNQGAKVALDDFGAGYSSFHYLRELPADALKIDGVFVRDMARHAANASIVQVIVDLARNLGMVAVAEWVEEPRTLEMLAEVGADYAQGFAIAPALSPKALLTAGSTADLIGNPQTLRVLETLSQTRKYYADLRANGGQSSLH
jgi:diguanylate cyclase (GGDEF)-like protein